MKRHTSFSQYGLPVFFAGLAGGLAEILWVSLYAASAPLDATAVAREVVAAVAAPFAQGPYTVPLAIAIHMLLSVGLAGVFAAYIWWPLTRRLPATATLITGAGVLAFVWATNFLVVLPAVHAPFVQLMPMGVTLASKVLFGLAMAGVLVSWPAAWVDAGGWIPNRRPGRGV